MIGARQYEPINPPHFKARVSWYPVRTYQWPPFCAAKCNPRRLRGRKLVRLLGILGSFQQLGVKQSTIEDLSKGKPQGDGYRSICCFLLLGAKSGLALQRGGFYRKAKERSALLVGMFSQDRHMAVGQNQWDPILG